MMAAAALAVATLLVVSAVLTAAWESVSHLGRSHVRTLEEEGFTGSDALVSLREREVGAKIAVRLLAGICDLSAVAVLALSGAAGWGLLSPWAGAAVGIGVVLVFGDLLPHAFAARFPVRIALTTAPMLLRVTRVTHPLTRWVAKLEDRPVDDVEGRSSELRDLEAIQKIGEEEGVLEASENLLVERAFRIDELTAWDVMVPRVEIFAWKEALTLGEIVDELAGVPYSRVPVYSDSVDDVTGIVYVREAYERISRGDRDATLGSIAREPFFVPGSLSLTQLLQDFQNRRIHLGIVADEFGGTDGLVTMEDILEELVGEIQDETDREEEAIVTVSDETVECSAQVDVRELEEALDVSLPKVDHRSLNGFILEELGQVPPEGESFRRSGVRFDILEATETQVLRVRLTKLANGHGEEEEAVED